MINDSFLINGSFLNYLRSKGLIGSSNPIISEFSVLSYETHIGADSRMVIPVLYGKIRKWEAEIKEMKKDIRSDTRQHDEELDFWTEEEMRKEHLRAEKENMRQRYRLEEEEEILPPTKEEVMQEEKRIRQEMVSWYSWANGMILQDEGGREIGSGAGSEYDPLDFNY